MFKRFWSYLWDLLKIGVGEFSVIRRRVVARMIDLTLVFFSAPLLVLLPADTLPAYQLAWFLMLMVSIYELAFLLSMGRTLGKKLCGLDIEYQQNNTLSKVIRSVTVPLFFAPAWYITLLVLGATIWGMGMTDTGKSIMDYTANSKVVRSS